MNSFVLPVINAEKRQPSGSNINPMLPIYGTRKEKKNNFKCNSRHCIKCVE